MTQKDISLLKKTALKYNIDFAHLEQVALISQSLFEQLKPIHKLKKTYEKLLITAAWLHDIGISIKFEQHHKHSYKLILHEDLPFLTKKEKILTATIARYHRKSSPKLAHPEFNKLAKEDQETVKKLSAILRIADGFDRLHLQSVKKIKTYIKKNEVQMYFHSTNAQANEQFGAIKKSTYFCELFNVNLKVVKV